jgi:hypothetical protein
VSKLEPVDRTRCQAEIHSYNAFVMGGPTRQVKRCDNKPTVIAKEAEPGPDGLRGSMSLCDSCCKPTAAQRAAVRAWCTKKSIELPWWLRDEAGQ